MTENLRICDTNQSTLRKPVMADALVSSGGSARELTAEELALVAGGINWHINWQRNYEAALDGALGGALLGAIGGTVLPGAGTGAGAAGGFVTGAYGNGLKDLIQQLRGH